MFGDVLGWRCLMCFNLVSATVKKKKTEKGKGTAGVQSASRNKKKSTKKESTAEDWTYCAAKIFKKCLKPTGLLFIHHKNLIFIVKI